MTCWSPTCKVPNVRADLIPPFAVVHVWCEAANQLKRAAKHDPSFDLEDLFLKLVSNEYQLWRVDSGFMVTGIRRIKGNVRRTLRIFYAIGSIPVGVGMKNYVREMIAFYEDCARTGKFGPAKGERCADLRFEGRKGWARALPEYGKRRLSNGNYEFFRRL